MIETEKIIIDGFEFTGFRIPTENAAILIIKAQYGFLGCGYFDLQTADKLNEHVALVTGVKNFDDMLKAQIAGVSRAAVEQGISKDLNGREALLLMVKK